MAANRSSTLLQQLSAVLRRKDLALKNKDKAYEDKTDAEARAYEANCDVAEAEKKFKSNKTKAQKAEKAITNLFKELRKLNNIIVKDEEDLKALIEYANSNYFNGASVRFHHSVSEDKKIELRAFDGEIDFLN